MMMTSWLGDSVNWGVAARAYEESNTEIRRPGWLLRLSRNLDNSKPAGVDRDDWF